MSKKSFPGELKDAWPEIFGEVEMNVIPLNYVVSITLTFKNDKVWEIEFLPETQKDEKAWAKFEEEVYEIVDSYDDEIEGIDFRLDTDRIKEDISKTTQAFLKNRRLK